MDAKEAASSKKKAELAQAGRKKLEEFRKKKAAAAAAPKGPSGTGLQRPPPAPVASYSSAPASKDLLAPPPAAPSGTTDGVPGLTSSSAAPGLAFASKGPLVSIQRVTTSAQNAVSSATATRHGASGATHVPPSALPQGHQPQQAQPPDGVPAPPGGGETVASTEARAVPTVLAQANEPSWMPPPQAPVPASVATAAAGRPEAAAPAFAPTPATPLLSPLVPAPPVLASLPPAPPVVSPLPVAQVQEERPPAQAQDVHPPAFLPPPPTGLAFAAPPVFKGGRSAAGQPAPRPPWLPSPAPFTPKPPEPVAQTSHGPPDASHGPQPGAAEAAQGGSSASTGGSSASTGGSSASTGGSSASTGGSSAWTSGPEGPGARHKDLPLALHAAAPGLASTPAPERKEGAAVPAGDLVVEESAPPPPSREVATASSPGPSSTGADSGVAYRSQEPGLGLARASEAADGLKGGSLVGGGGRGPQGSSAPPIAGARSTPPSPGIHKGGPPFSSSTASSPSAAHLQEAGGWGSAKAKPPFSADVSKLGESLQSKGARVEPSELPAIHGDARPGPDAVPSESRAKEPGAEGQRHRTPLPPFLPPSSSTAPTSTTADPWPSSTLPPDPAAAPSHLPALDPQQDSPFPASEGAAARVGEAASAGTSPRVLEGPQVTLSAAAQLSQGPRRGFFSRAFAVLAPPPEAEGPDPFGRRSPSLHQTAQGEARQQAPGAPAAQRQALEAEAGTASHGIAGPIQAPPAGLDSRGQSGTEDVPSGASAPAGYGREDMPAPTWRETSRAAGGGSALAAAGPTANAAPSVVGPSQTSPSAGASLVLSNSVGTRGPDTGASPAKEEGIGRREASLIAPQAQASGPGEHQQSSSQPADKAGAQSTDSSAMVSEPRSDAALSSRVPSSAPVEKKRPFYRPSWLSFQRKPQAGESVPEASAGAGQGERFVEEEARAEAPQKGTAWVREDGSTPTEPGSSPRADSGYEPAAQGPSDSESRDLPEGAPGADPGRAGAGANGVPAPASAPSSSVASAPALFSSAPSSSLSSSSTLSLSTEAPSSSLPTSSMVGGEAAPWEDRGAGWAGRRDSSKAAADKHQDELPLSTLPSGAGREEPSGLRSGLGADGRLLNGTGSPERGGRGLGLHKGSPGTPWVVPAQGPTPPQAKRELFASPAPGSSRAANSSSAANGSTFSSTAPSTESLYSSTWASSAVASNPGSADSGGHGGGPSAREPSKGPLASCKAGFGAWASGRDARGVAAMKPPLPAAPADRVVLPGALAQGDPGAALRDRWGSAASRDSGEPASAGPAAVPGAADARRHPGSSSAPPGPSGGGGAGSSASPRGAPGTPLPSRGAHAVAPPLAVPSPSAPSPGAHLQRSSSGRSAGAGGAAGSPGYPGDKKFPGLPVLGPLEAAKDAPVKASPARGGRATMASADFSALEQHIEDLTLEKFTLERALASAHLVAESLARENSALTDDYNSQGKVVEQMEEEVDRLKAEITAQQMVMESQRMEKLAAHHEVLAAVERSQSLASEVVALEEKSLRLRSSELKLERELERLTEEAAAHKRTLEQLEKERAVLRGNVQALQEEKKQLKVQLRRAAVGGALRDVREQTEAEVAPPRLLSASTSTDDVPVPGNEEGEGVGVAREAGPPQAEAAEQPREGSRGTPQAGSAPLPGGEASAAAPESQEAALSPGVEAALARVKALLLSVQGRDSSVERVVQALGEALAASSQVPALSSAAGSAEDGAQLLELLSLPALLPESVDILLVEDQSTLANIDSMLTELRAESHALAAALDMETESSNALRAANKELSAKLASQTQRMELLVSQSMLAAAAAAGGWEANLGAESPLVKAASSSQTELEQVQQQLMLLRSPSSRSAAASPGPARLASEAGQLEYLDEGDEVAQEMVSWLLRFLPGKADTTQAGA